jgi:hypothetical protein
MEWMEIDISERAMGRKDEEQRRMGADCSGGQSSPWAVVSRGRKDIRLCQWEVAGKCTIKIVIKLVQTGKLRQKKKWKLCATNLGDKRNPWKPIHRINLAIFILWNHFSPAVPWKRVKLRHARSLHIFQFIIRCHLMIPFYILLLASSLNELGNKNLHLMFSLTWLLNFDTPCCPRSPSMSVHIQISGTASCAYFISCHCSFRRDYHSLCHATIQIRLTELNTAHVHRETAAASVCKEAQLQTDAVICEA